MKLSNYIFIFLFLISAKLTAQNAEVTFDNFTLEIEPLVLWEQSKLLEKTFLVDAEVDIELGEELEGATIKIVNSKLTELTIDMRFETSITIMNEGPHCDLIDWKHHTSDWVPLQIIKSNSCKANNYTNLDKEKFPKVTVDEIVEAVEKHCVGWGEIAKTIKSINEYPSAVSVSRYFLRISGKDETGNKVTRILTFNVPMGC